tara:strand:- start:919 stop:1095 length:177 start_codon:yes stop_codon:yes gene_type:complete
MKIKNNEKLIGLVTDLYWDFDRLTSSGQETLEELATLVGVPTEEEMNNMSIEELKENM